MEEDLNNIDELLSTYIDDELSQRQETEVKRLITHNPDLSAKVEELKKQKLLLNALPKSNAPAGLLDDVVGSLERKFILDEYSAVSEETRGRKTLLLQRAMTAAIILVLFGSLATLIINITKPPSPTVNNFIATENTPATSKSFAPQTKPDTTDAIPADMPIFRASLNLKTQHAITMNDYIKKLIFNHHLNNAVTPPKIVGTTSTIKLTCGIDSIVALLTDLQTEWDKCKEATLDVYDHALAKNFVIEKISAGQLLDIFGEQKFYTRMQMAKDFADFNALNPYKSRHLAYKDPSPVNPELTSSSQKKIPTRLEGGEKNKPRNNSNGHINKHAVKEQHQKWRLTKPFS